MVVGEHGTTEAMLWSSVRAGGAPLADALRVIDPHRSVDEHHEQVEREVRFANITIIEDNDASQFGIGAACARIADGPIPGAALDAEVARIEELL